MKIKCRYTGLPLVTDNLFPAFTLASEHPLFSAKNKVLMSEQMLRPWYEGTLSADAKRVLFLAIAINNNLVLVRDGVIATPSIKTVENCMFKLLRIVSWLEDAKRAGLFPQLPQYVVSLDTADMDNFQLFLQDVERARSERIADEDKQEFERRQEVSIEKLIKNINLGMLSAARALNGTIARWALSVTPTAQLTPIKEADGSMTPRAKLWAKMLVMTDKQLLAADSNEIQKLHDFMEWELPHGNIASAAVMKRCREMVEVTSNILGNIDTEFFMLDEADIKPASLATGKVELNGQQYSPKVLEALRKHEALKNKLRASATKIDGKDI